MWVLYLSLSSFSYNNVATSPTRTAMQTRARPWRTRTRKSWGTRVELDITKGVFLKVGVNEGEEPRVLLDGDTVWERV